VREEKSARKNPLREKGLFWGRGKGKGGKSHHTRRRKEKEKKKKKKITPGVGTEGKRKFVASVGVIDLGGEKKERGGETLPHTHYFV